MKEQINTKVFFKSIVVNVGNVFEGPNTSKYIKMEKA